MMNIPKKFLEVNNLVSLYSHPKTMARWNIKGDAGQITLYLGSAWDEAETSARNTPSKIHIRYSRWQDLILEHFIGVMVFGYLMERICIERAHERIRLKHDKCYPCVVKGITNKMFDYIVCSWKIE